MPTIKDVAVSAGVSIATVSHVINGTRFVSDELKQRVLSAMEALDYRPNTLARGLRSGRTRTIGIIVPDASNMFFAEIGRAIEDIGFENGYSVIVCNSDNNLDKQRSYIDTLITKQIDGIIFISAGAPDAELEPLKQAGIPIVVADREIPPGQADVVLIDNELGGYLATQHLIELGHTRIACIAGPTNLNPSAGRITGFFRALHEHGLSAPPDWVISGDFQIESGDACMARLLASDLPPSAVFVCNDMMAIGAMGAIRRQGLRVPEDISVVGFDNIALSKAVYPPLTTVRQPIAEIAASICSMLFIRMDAQGEIPAQQRVVLEPDLVIRASTSPRR